MKPLTPDAAREATKRLIEQTGQAQLDQLRASYSIALPQTITDTEMQHFINGITLTVGIVMMSLGYDQRAIMMALASPTDYAEQILGNALALIGSVGETPTTDTPTPTKADMDALLADLDRQMRGE